ncbi:MAG: hypothetical protein AAF621_03995 [Pseudomonadota bacterium]
MSNDNDVDRVLKTFRRKATHGGKKIEYNKLENRSHLIEKTKTVTGVFLSLLLFFTSGLDALLELDISNMMLISIVASLVLTIIYYIFSDV